MKPNTPKHFVLQLGSFIALYISVTALIILIFNIINLKFPDAVAGTYEAESARIAMRGAMAFVIVFFPTYVILTRVMNQIRRKEMNNQYTLLARWLVYLSLLVAGGVLLGDLVTLIMYFLNGEITTRFITKVLALLLIVGATFHYYFLDVRGFFTKEHVAYAVNYAIGAGVLVLASLAFGYQYIETPGQVREMRFDEQQVTDLQNIQAGIENYYQLHNELPASIADAYGRLPVPVAPNDRAAYTYKTTDATHYQLCATFAAASTDIKYATPVMAPESNYNWAHESGEWCFDRVISSTLKSGVTPTTN